MLKEDRLRESIWNGGLDDSILSTGSCETLSGFIEVALSQLSCTTVASCPVPGIQSASCRLVSLYATDHEPGANRFRSCESRCQSIAGILPVLSKIWITVAHLGISSLLVPYTVRRITEKKRKSAKCILLIQPFAVTKKQDPRYCIIMASLLGNA